MILRNLYERVVETTGLDIVSIGSLQAAVANCMADLTSRGYRTFKEINLDTITEDNIVANELGYFEAIIPTDEIRKVLYCKLFFPSRGVVAHRLSLSNPEIQKVWANGRFRTMLKGHEAVFYIKDTHLIVEYDYELGLAQDFSFAYYSRLIAPTISIIEGDEAKLDNTIIDIRKEFEDALVFYACYFYYSRYVKDTEKIAMYLNQYKYFVEDITHELAYEDEYFEEDSVVHHED